MKIVLVKDYNEDIMNGPMAKGQIFEVEGECTTHYQHRIDGKLTWNKKEFFKSYEDATSGNGDALESV